MKPFCAATLAVATAILSMSSALADDHGFVSEIRLGVLAHDEGMFSSMKEKGLDANAEILFSDWGWLGDDWELRPHIGATWNTEGGTDQAYVGLTAGRDILGPIFLELSFGGAIHDGELDTTDPERRSLGCHVLFRGAAAIGVHLGDNLSLMAHADHISNANLCDRNEGLETAGVRLGWRF